MVRKYKNEYYITSDFCLTSTLVTLGFPVVELDKFNPKRINFNFIDTDELRQSVDLYWKKQIKVYPLDFYYAQRQLKSLMYQGGLK